MKFWRKAEAVADPRDGRVSPGFSHCMRCRTSWDKVEGRTVWYHSEVPHDQGCDERHDLWTAHRGSFAICELCWSELSATQRLPYYVLLWVNQHLSSQVFPTRPIKTRDGSPTELLRLVERVMSESAEEEREAERGRSNDDSHAFPSQ